MQKSMRKKPVEPIEDEEIIYVSRAELKKDAKEIQQLATELAELKVMQRAKLPLNEEIDASLRLADKIKGKHDAYSRNIRFLAKLLAEVDIEAIKSGLDKINNKHSYEKHKITILDELRNEVIAKGNDKIEELLTEYEGFERQRFRQLVRQAAKEVKVEKPGKSYKELFKYLKENVTFEI